MVVLLENWYNTDLVSESSLSRVPLDALIMEKSLENEADS